LYSCTCSIITEGIAKVCLPARSITACVTARVSGSVIVKSFRAPGGGDLDAPAERRDLVLHHVHADAAAGDLGHLGCGRESRHEDELGELRFGQLDVGREQLRLDRLLADARDS
jgi:hypothetical protein